ncbi:MAG: guanylate kinase [Gammaproteobacteria bacterium]
MTGTLYIVSAPSGAGKTSLVKTLLARHKHLRVSVSHTTRQPRANEINGIHYHFTTKTEFETQITQNAFLEHAEVFGNYYGTSTQWVESTLKQDVDVILEIDWQGAQQVRASQRNATSIFILPPSLSTLKERLIRRGQDSPTVIQKRVQEAQLEMSHFQEYDYIVVNDQFEEAAKDLTSIITSERLRVHAQKRRLGSLLDDLLK